MPAFEKGSKIPSLFMAETGHVVRVVKADQAAAYLSPDKSNGHSHAPNAPKKPSEVRLVASGPDYCDLELVCGCGEVTRFRAWNSPASAEEKTTVG